MNLLERIFVWLLVALPFGVLADAYSEKVLADKPVAHWRFQEVGGVTVDSVVGGLKGKLEGNRPLGPRPAFYPDFAKDTLRIQMISDFEALRI